MAATNPRMVETGPSEEENVRLRRLADTTVIRFRYITVDVQTFPRPLNTVVDPISKEKY